MRYLAFDTETSGVDVFNDHIVQAVLSLYDGDENTLIKEREWFIDPGIDIPQGAVDVHGFSNEFLKEHGKPTKDVISEISDTLIEWYDEAQYDTVLSIMNAPFDTSILNAELARIGHSAVNWDSFLIGDVLVIDKAIDKFRKGSRKLVDMAKHYKIKFDESEAHDAGFDNWLSVAVLSRILKKRPVDASLSGHQHFMEFQRKAKAEQAKSFQSYLRRKENDDSIVINGDWPTQWKG